MSSHAAKKLKLDDDLPQCPYGIPVFISAFLTCRFWSLGSKCYRKNPAHFTEYAHSDTTSTSTTVKVKRSSSIHLICSSKMLLFTVF